MSAIENKLTYRRFLNAFAHPHADGFRGAIDAFIAPNSNANAFHPINAMDGAQGYHAQFIALLLRAFEGLYRRDYIVLAGSFEGNDWVSSTGYFVGKFVKPLFGIKPSGKLAYLRIGEFHRIVNDKSVESYTYIDFPELMMNTGEWPLSPAQGYSGHVPGPASQDGLSFDGNDPALAVRSLNIIEDMLKCLATPDEAWRPYWHPNMIWYGPAAFGRFVGIEEFSNFQVPFEAAFEGWGGGLADHTPTKHFTRFGDGNFACIGGWPSLQGRHVGPFLGFEPTGTLNTFRVCDWWRREGDLLSENWVFVDIPDLLLQWGYDLFAEIGED